jgi:hypothetical protein
LQPSYLLIKGDERSVFSGRRRRKKKRTHAEVKKGVKKDEVTPLLGLEKREVYDSL